MERTEREAKIATERTAREEREDVVGKHEMDEIPPKDGKSRMP